MSIQVGQSLDRDTLNRAYVSKSATGTQIMAGSLRLLGGVTIDGTTTLGALTVGAINAGSSSITTTGAITAGTFSGSGASLTSLNATNLSSGTVADARLSTNVMLLNAAQTITGLKTFQGEQKFHMGAWTDPHNGTGYAIKWAQGAAGNTLRLTGDATFLGNLNMSGDKKLAFDANGVDAPSDTSVGTKIQLYGTGKYNIGIDSATLWYDAYSYHRFYSNSGGTARTMRFEVNESGTKVYGSEIVEDNLEVRGEIQAGIANEFPDPLLISENVAKWTASKNSTVDVAFDSVQIPTGTNANGSVKTTATGVDGWAYYDYYFDVNPSEWITFSAYAFATTTGKTSQLMIQWLDNAKATLSHSSLTTSDTALSWTRYKISAPAPASARYFRVRVDNDGAAGAIIYFAAFQVERGRAMTGFKPYTGGKIASFFDKGIKLASDGEIHSEYNNNFIIKDHGNGNVTLSAAGGNLYLGYQNTGNVFLSRPLTNASSLKMIDTDGTLYYRGESTDTRYVHTAGDTMSGDLSIVKDNAWLTLDSSSASDVTGGAGISIGESGYKGAAALQLTYTHDGYGHIGMGDVDAVSNKPAYEAMQLHYQSNVVKFFATPNVNGSTIWHSGNDGAGSGLDADLLDGMSPSTGNTASTIVYRDGSGNFSAGTITASLNGTATNISNTGTVTLATATESNAITITQPSYATDKPVKLLNFNWYSDVWSVGNIRSGATPSAGLGIFLNSVEKFRFTDGVLKIGTNNVWHQGNDGSGSGLDADLLDGVHKTSLMSSTVYREKLVIPVGGIAAGTAITIPNSRVYVLGSNRLQVFRDGILQEPVDEYTEASTSTVSFLYDLPEGARVTFIITNTG